MEIKYQVIMDKLVDWGNSSDKLSAIIIVGSYAREDHGADEYSDLDVLLFVNDADYFLSSDQWLGNIGKFYVSIFSILTKLMNMRPGASNLYYKDEPS